MPRTGQKYIDAINDGRTIYLNGELIKNHITHPAFAGAVKSIAQIYDFNSTHNSMTFTTPTGRITSKAWELPTSGEKLMERVTAALRTAQHSFGWLGRSPDHVAAALTGMVTHPEIFEAHSLDSKQALLQYYEYARDNDLYIAYTIVSPQGNRSKSPGECQDNLFHTLRVVSESGDGIIVRGAKMLGTAAVLADELLVGVQNPMKDGVDDDYAISFATPLNAEGIKIMSRKSYAVETNAFDDPLTSRFDESDSIIYFDHVFVPWARIFVYRDVQMCRQQFHSTAAEILMDLQSQARLTVKLNFLAGLAREVALTNGVIDYPSVREMLAELACQATLSDGLLKALYSAPVRHHEYYIPNQTLLYACQATNQTIYPKVLDIMRRLSGGGLIMLPSHIKDFMHIEIGSIIEATQYSSSKTPRERVKLMKLAWDAIGSEFGSRHLQYEMFYSGPHFAALARLYSQYDWESGRSLVVEALSSEFDDLTTA